MISLDIMLAVLFIILSYFSLPCSIMLIKIFSVSYITMHFFLIIFSQMTLVVGFYFPVIVYLHLCYQSLFMAYYLYFGWPAKLLRIKRDLFWLYLISNILFSLWQKFKIKRWVWYNRQNKEKKAMITESIFDRCEVSKLMLYIR